MKLRIFLQKVVFFKDLRKMHQAIQFMTYAVLRAQTKTILVNGDGSKWEEVLTVKAAVQNYPEPVMERIKNPKPPVYQIQQCTYTNSEFPADLDAGIINKTKAVKLQKMFDTEDPMDQIESSTQWREITSMNQIHMACSHPQKNSCLDDIFIPLPLMLKWICDEGWKLEHATDHKFTNTFIFTRV